MSTKITCPNCQRQTHRMAITCPKCNHALISNDDQDQLPNNQNIRGQVKALIHPRLVARKLIPQTSSQQAIFWIGFAGAMALMADAIEPIIGEKARFDDFQSIAKSAALGFGVGALSSVVGIYFLSHLIQWLGKRLDVVTTAKEVRALFAWATPPIFLWAVALLTEWIVYYPDYFVTNQFLQHVPGEMGLWWTTSGIHIITVLCFLWFIVFLVTGLSEIGNSLIWSSLATLTLAGLIIFAFLMIILYVKLLQILRRY